MTRAALICASLIVAGGFASLSPAANASDSGATSRHRTHPYHVARVHGIPATAQALSPAVKTPVREPETDGLSRNRDDCNMGCIDN